MPHDKQFNGTHAKPLTPNLSSAFRQTKSPLTPKLAGCQTLSPTSPPRRGLYTSVATADPPLANDGQLTPALSGNITPRSAARKSRTGTQSPATPTSGSNASSRPKSMVEATRSRGVRGLGISGASTQNGAIMQKTLVRSNTSGASLARRLSGSTTEFESAASPQFFHADDAKSSVSSQAAEERQRPEPKVSSFFHAGDIAKPTSGFIAPAVAPLPKHLENSAKFVHAGTLPACQSPRARSEIGGRSPSPSPRSPKFPLPELSRHKRPGPRPPSPLKESNHNLISPLSNSSYSPKLILKPSQLAPAIDSTAAERRRRSSSSSTESAARPVQTATPYHLLQPTINLAERRTGTISPQGQPIRSTSVISPLSLDTSSPQVTSAIALRATEVPISTTKSPIQSPVKSDSAPHTQNDQQQKLNEQAATARRERKVLDLEISNSSLLAINKTLEREMRKQSAELRRFRRLSRSGRLSSITGGSIRSMSGQSSLSTFTEMEKQGGQLSDLEEMSSDDDDDDEASDDDDSSSMTSSFDDAALSPNSRAEHHSRQRARDERRLILDLTKHQQLLIDSQKMSQSIKRCLGCTEELIREGTRALEYKVKVSEVKLGGRVLHGEDHDGDEQDGDDDDDHPVEEGLRARKGLLSPSTTLDMLEEANLFATGLQ